MLLGPLNTHTIMQFMSLLQHDYNMEIRVGMKFNDAIKILKDFILPGSYENMELG